MNIQINYCLKNVCKNVMKNNLPFLENIKFGKSNILKSQILLLFKLRNLVEIQYNVHEG